MMMSLEEAIETEQKNVEVNYNMVDTCHTDEGVYLEMEDAYRDRAEYHQQLAEWLKELKELKARPTVWIPLNKDGHEPKEEGFYLLCLDDEYVTTVYYDGKDWALWLDAGEPIAWMPLPKTYKTESEGET